MNVPFLVLAFTAVTAAAVAGVARIRRSDSTASGPFIGLMLAIAGYAAAAALEAAAVTIPLKRFWSTMEYVGSGSAVAYFVLFAMRYSGAGYESRLRSWLWVAPFLHVLLVATNPWHHLVWTALLPGPVGSNQIVYRHGPGFYAIMASVYIHFLIAIVLLARMALSSVSLYRRQVRAAIAAATVPLLGGTAYMLNLTPPGLNITPMSFAFTGVLLFGSLFRLSLLDLIPIARDGVVERMEDGIVVVDNRTRIVDTNPAARRILRITEQYVGLRVEAVLPGLQIRDSGAGRIRRVEHRDVAGETRYIEVDITPLADDSSTPGGQILLLRDVTDRHLAETSLRQANLNLRNRLNEMESSHARLQEEAIRDVLTGLYNRRYFEDALAREMARAERELSPVAVILLDLDHFKHVNDTLGHPAGDRALREFASLLSRSCRAGDIACRYGGEEFALVLPGASGDAAYTRAEELRRETARTLHPFTDREIRITVSGGVSAFPSDAETVDGLIERADRALYHAKHAGRDRIERAASSPSSSWVPPLQ